MKGYMVGPNGKLVSDLANRAGWALAAETTSSPTTWTPRYLK